ncbi:hypothetical protein IJ579_01390 [bacterium]|nr:hypothetical protein [bacterium]
MTEVKEKTVLFDPGFARHTTILSISSEYLYNSINKFKNFGQRKNKFKMLYPQITQMADNNIGFCLGSLLWAVYIKKTNPAANIEGNPCIGDTFNKEETVAEVDFSIEFFNQIKRDAKYYLGQNYEINPLHIEILNTYKDFLVLNTNFVSTKTVEDLKLPEDFKTPSEIELQTIHNKIKEVIQSGKLLDLVEVYKFVK